MGWIATSFRALAVPLDHANRQMRSGNSARYLCFFWLALKSAGPDHYSRASSFD